MKLKALNGTFHLIALLAVCERFTKRVMCVILKTYLLTSSAVLREKGSYGGVFVMGGPLKIHYDVTALSASAHRVIVKDNRQDEYVIPVVLVSIRSYCRSRDFPEMTF